MKQRGRGVMHPFRKREDDNLTTEMALVWFERQVTTLAKLPGQPWQRTKPKLRDAAKEVLLLLGLDDSVYAKPPPRRKCGEGGP